MLSVVASHAVDTIVLAVQADGLAERHRAWSGLGSKWTCDVLLAFYDFPAEHWKHTTNPIESTFAAVRLRDHQDQGLPQPHDGAHHGLQAVPVGQHVNGGAKLVHPGGAKLVHLTLCGTRCWGVVPVVHRRDLRCFV